MKAKHKLFDLEDCLEVADFLTELGPKRLIAITSKRRAIIVFYWAEDPSFEAGMYRGSKYRCGINTPQPAMITPTMPSPGTLMS